MTRWRRYIFAGSKLERREFARRRGRHLEVSLDMAGTVRAAVYLRAGDSAAWLGADDSALVADRYFRPSDWLREETTDQRVVAARRWCESVADGAIIV